MFVWETQNLPNDKRKKLLDQESLRTNNLFVMTDKVNETWLKSVWTPRGHFLRRSKLIWQSSSRKNPPFPPRSPDTSDAGTSWEKHDDPVKDGGAGDKGGGTRGN